MHLLLDLSSLFTDTSTGLSSMTTRTKAVGSRACSFEINYFLKEIKHVHNVIQCKKFHIVVHKLNQNQ